MSDSETIIMPGPIAPNGGAPGGSVPPGGGAPVGEPPSGGAQSGGPRRYKKDKKFDFSKIIIPVSAVATGGLTMLAAPSLVDATGILGISKILLLGSAAGFVSFVVNDRALKYGPELCAKGFKLAAFSSVIPILIVGSSAAVFGNAGLIIDPVNELNLQEHGQELSVYSESVNSYASQIGQLSPVVDTAAKDIPRQLLCEKSFGCLSKGIGGKGKTYRAVLPMATQAQEISVQLAAGEAFRKKQLAVINQFGVDYQNNLSKNQLSHDERRRNAARISARIKQEISPLRQALPLALLQSYGEALKAKITINKNPEATRNVNALLSRHGRAVATAVERIKPDKSINPELPAKAGVAQAFERIGRFWPIGVLVASIELLIPITLWLFAYLNAFWKLYEDEHTPTNGGRHAD